MVIYFFYLYTAPVMGLCTTHVIFIHKYWLHATAQRPHTHLQHLPKNEGEVEGGAANLCIKPGVVNKLTEQYLMLRIDRMPRICLC